VANGHNLIISYDLKKPDKDYAAVIEEIKKLGNWAKIHYSVWYVDSKFTAAQARDLVWTKMDPNDTLFVIDAKANNAAWKNLSKEVSDFVISRWNQ